MRGGSAIPRGSTYTRTSAFWSFAGAPIPRRVVPATSRELGFQSDDARSRGSARSAPAPVLLEYGRSASAASTRCSSVAASARASRPPVDVPLDYDEHVERWAGYGRSPRTRRDRAGRTREWVVLPVALEVRAMCSIASSRRAWKPRSSAAWPAVVAEGIVPLLGTAARPTRVGVFHRDWLLKRARLVNQPPQPRPDSVPTGSASNLPQKSNKRAEHLRYGSGAFQSNFRKARDRLSDWQISGFLGSRISC